MKATSSLLQDKAPNHEKQNSAPNTAGSSSSNDLLTSPSLPRPSTIPSGAPDAAGDEQLQEQGHAALSLTHHLLRTVLPLPNRQAPKKPKEPPDLLTLIS